MHQPATYILRKKDATYITQFKSKDLRHEEWIRAMSEHPIMIERPIVQIEEKAYLARPFDVFEKLIVEN